MFFSKSKYCNLWQCPKMIWLRKYKPEEYILDDGVQARMDAGTDVGDLAMGLFGDYVDVTTYNNDQLDLSAMLNKTKAELEKETNVICEASFNYDGLYCAVDLLKRENNGWTIYEIKSSTHNDSPIYMADIAYQKYVLEKCGLNITGTYLICIDNQYVFDGVLDIHKLFKITDVSESIAAEYENVEHNLTVAEQILSHTDEPNIDISCDCFNPYGCAFWHYCSRHLPKPSVFDLYRMQTKKKFEYYYDGITSYEAIQASNRLTNDKQRRQIELYLEDKGTYVNKSGIKKFLTKLSYPLYFLDFETMQPVIPEFVGTKPYQQIPFQYSLHYLEAAEGTLYHKEFLAESGVDPRRALAEQLCKDIPMNTCVTAYNKGFECGRIKELAEMFPDLAEHLLNINDNIVDLLEPFQSGYYYNRAMGGSFSIKSVLPAIYPDDPTLDYHNLEGVHNGSEAMSIFPKLKYMEPHEREEMRKNLLKYCERDTYAMVKVWEEVVRVSD